MKIREIFNYSFLNKYQNRLLSVKKYKLDIQSYIIKVD